MLIERGVLVRAMKILITIIEKKAVSPFDHVRIEPAPGGVAITASDGTMSASVMAPSEGGIDACVPARDLLAAASGADNGDRLTLTVHNREAVTVGYSGAEAKLLNSPSFDFRAACLDGDDGGPHHQVDAGPFSAALAWVSPAMCIDDITRLHLGSVLLEGDQVVATDGHRLHVATVAGLGWDRALVPAKAIQLLLRLLPGGGQLEVAVHEGVLLVATAAWSLRTRLLDHKQFPPYQQVIPAPAAAAFTMGVEARGLGAAVHRVGVGAGKRSVPLRMTANGKIVLATTSAEVQRVASVDPTSSTHDDLAGDHVIGIDGRFLRDAVDLTGEVILRFGDVLAPIVVDAGARLAVVMPMRL
jgi:DNA polymerase III sliding clamp (beta) subunit (PCNA family)